MSSEDITPSVDREKREPEDNGRGVGSPSKMQKISSVAVGHGAAHKLGEVPYIQSYEEDQVEMIRAYQEQHDEGKHFVHVRKRNSRNRDLQVMQRQMSKR